jgi:hypothetical protein
MIIKFKIKIHAGTDTWNQGCNGGTGIPLRPDESG